LFYSKVDITKCRGSSGLATVHLILEEDREEKKETRERRIKNLEETGTMGMCSPE